MPLRSKGERFERALFDLQDQQQALLDAQAELEASRERYSDLYNAAPVGYVTLSYSGCIQQVNLSASQLLGQAAAALVGRPLLVFIAKSDRRRYLRHFAQRRLRKERSSIELSLASKPDGAEVVVELISVPFFWLHARRPNYHCVLVDLTIRRQGEAALRQARHELELRVLERTEELTRANAALHTEILAHQKAVQALRESEKNLADFFEQSPLGLLSVEPDGQIRRLNRSQLDLFGYPVEECIGQPLAKFLVDPELGFEALARLARKETLTNFRARLRQKNGSIRHVLMDVNGLWKQGQLVFSRWFVRDVTHRLELEREILAISEREQQRLGRDLHDGLCQQLSGIEFLSQTLASQLAACSSPGVARAREIAAMIRQAIDHTRELARGLSPVPLEGDGLMIALQELTARTQKLFHIRCSLRNETPVLIKDEAVGIHLYRIAQEAISNAIRHGKAARIDVGLTARAGRIVLAVRDNGLGISQKPRTRKGMGLRVMQYRAGFLGGTLVVQRQPTGGTTVACTVSNESHKAPKPP